MTCINKSVYLFLCSLNLNTQTTVYGPLSSEPQTCLKLSKFLQTRNTISPKVQLDPVSPTQPNSLKKKPKLSISKARPSKPRPIPKFKWSTIYPEITPMPKLCHIKLPRPYPNIWIRKSLDGWH